jgi:uroporphyrinogen decarboxylase
VPSIEWFEAIAMDSKERMLLALNREKPDRLPVTVHQWQKYHLDVYMQGMTDLQACAACGLDAQIQYPLEVGQFWLDDFTRFNTAKWRDVATVVSADPDHRLIEHEVTTPEGTLTCRVAGNRQTSWVTDFLIKQDDDIYLIEKYMPVPPLDVADVAWRYDEVGGQGILRGTVWGDQAGCWQHAACLHDITALIFATFEKPEWVHELMRILLAKKLCFIETMKGAKFDLVETGGGAASSTLISPAIHAEYCLPYDRAMHDALHSLGFKTAYHTCGGTVGIEEYIVGNGTDASETLAPPSVGGNQEPWEFKKKVGNRIALIGGIDQHSTLTRQTPEQIRAKVHELFDKVGYEGGLICSASDHFFETPPENIVAFANAAKECVYG